jgi:hypothetical protein
MSRREARLFGLDDLSADYLLTKAIADHKTPAEMIGEMVRERLTVHAKVAMATNFSAKSPPNTASHVKYH